MNSSFLHLAALFLLVFSMGVVEVAARPAHLQAASKPDAQTDLLFGPDQLTSPQMAQTALAIFLGNQTTCAITDSFLLKCWGRNDYGQLGDGNTSDRNIPVQVSGLPDPVVEVSPGTLHTCAVTNILQLFCWGLNNYGQIGDGTTDNRSAPTLVASDIIAVAVGSYHTCALNNVGGVLCWGQNFYGQVGDGTNTDRYSPTPVNNLASSVSAITSGSSHTCARTSSGGAKCWGNNFRGQLGDTTNVDRNEPVTVSGTGTGVASLSAGEFHTCGLSNSGGVYCWGRNFEGQLGDETTDHRNYPEPVSDLNSGVSQISSGSFHSCALMTTGDVKCWGYNEHGTLGNGANSNTTIPVDVIGLSGPAVAISSGSHTCAMLFNDDRLLCWGRNESGQLGNGTNSNRNTPTAVLWWSNFLPMLLSNN